MANICYCHMEAAGPVESIRHLVDRIKKQDKEDLDNLFGWFEANNYYGICQEPEDLDNDFLCLDFTCKWSPPEGDLENLSRIYPDLTFNIRYEESGCDLYGTLVYRAGKKIEDIVMNERQYREKYDPEYNEIAKYIKTMNYKKFLRNFEEEAKKLKNHHLYYLFEELLLKKIKDDDLLLFINYEWEYVGDVFQGRIKEL